MTLTGILFAFVLGLIVNAPAYWALAKIGRNPWEFVVLAIPLAGLVYLWFLAFGRWPGQVSAPAEQAASPPPPQA